MPVPPPRSANSVLCIGAVHWDSLARARRPITPDTSTPSDIGQAPGGVATNVARALVRLDVPATLCGVVGDDVAGRALREQLNREGLALRLLERKGKATGQYLALHDPDGSLVAACVDDAILAEAPPETFRSELALLAAEMPAHALWFADANLPPDILKAVADEVPEGHLAADAVSVAKAGRLTGILGRLRLLFANRAEAAELADCPGSAPLKEIAARLHDRDVSEVIITDGTRPVLASDGTAVREYAPEPATIRDVTGAGDALIAGTLAALARGYGLFDAVPLGLAAAHLTVQSAGAVSNELAWPRLSHKPDVNQA
ncbi:PfkB family carbohydrate kinase [uncultured Roseibium sp.]|uniref:PfkB family carbohydrate kinase n=1 Tax=uncultured Roseibium sp. TaxID=1936171 RepID=UPI003217A6E8